MSDTDVIDDQATVVEVMAYRVTMGGAKVDVRKFGGPDRWSVSAPYVLDKGEYLHLVDGREAALDFAIDLVQRLAAMHERRSVLRAEEYDLVLSLQEATVSASPRAVT